MITSTRKIVYWLHDQAEDEESKSLPIINTLRNMTILEVSMTSSNLKMLNG